MAAGVEWDYLDTIRTALLYNPVAGALAVVWLIGAYAVVFGILLLAFGIKLRGLERSLPHAVPTLA